MTPSVAESQLSPEKLSVLVAAAAILQLSESMLPHPIPGLRLGLANIVSLIVLCQYGFKPALTITLLRTVVSSFVLGSFLSPGFILSFTAGLFSILCVGVFSQISNQLNFFHLSPIGLGIIGAFVHNMTQFGLAYLVFFHHPGLLMLVPWMIFGSVIIGLFTGSLSIGVLNRLSFGADSVQGVLSTEPPMEERIYLAGDSIIHRCSAEVKIGLLLVVTLLAVCIENMMLYSVLLLGIMVLIKLSSLSFGRVFSVVRKVWVVVLSAFLLPLYFNYGNQDLISTPFGYLHQEAVMSGVIFSVRLIILALLSNLIARTTTTESFGQGIYTYLKPFDNIGLNSRGVASHLSRSITALPDVWMEIRSLLRQLLEGKPRNVKTFYETVITLFLYLFKK